MKVKTSLLVGLCLLLTVFSSWWSTSLKEITKPYLGEYECTQALVGKEDWLNKFSYIRLELCQGKKFQIHFQEKNEKKRTVEGSFSYDEEKEMLTLQIGKGRFARKKVRLKNGEFTIFMRLGKQNVRLKFKQTA